MRGCKPIWSSRLVAYIRARDRSLPASVLVDQIRELAAHGTREVVLLGQTVNAYHDGTTDFASLLRRLADVDGLERIRFTSPHPAERPGAVIDAIDTCPTVTPQ